MTDINQPTAADRPRSGNSPNPIGIAKTGTAISCYLPQRDLLFIPKSFRMNISVSLYLR